MKKQTIELQREIVTLFPVSDLVFSLNGQSDPLSERSDLGLNYSWRMFIALRLQITFHMTGVTLNNV